MMEKIKEIYDIEVTKEKVENTGCCDCCENITRVSDKDDDFVINYDTTYKIHFKMIDMEVTLCEDCLKQLKSKIDDYLK